MFLSTPACFSLRIGMVEIFLALGWDFTWNPNEWKWEKTFALHCLMRQWWYKWVPVGRNWQKKKWFSYNHGWQDGSDWRLLGNLYSCRCVGSRGGVWLFLIPKCTQQPKTCTIRQRQIAACDPNCDPNFKDIEWMFI